MDLARLAERLGFVRYWFAEHHGMASIASSAPEILIEHVASATSRIRVGSGGIMLPNHTPLRVAEVFHTLETLHPDRIDLGLGRALGTDPATSRALRPFDGEHFPEQVQEMLALSRRQFPPEHPFASVRVVPDGVTLPPIWVLASSGATASFAGSMGMGYGFARHFSPTPPGPAIRAYREHFRPSAQFPLPHVIEGTAAGANAKKSITLQEGASEVVEIDLSPGAVAEPTPPSAPDEPAAAGRPPTTPSGGPSGAANARSTSAFPTAPLPPASSGCVPVRRSSRTPPAAAGTGAWDLGYCPASPRAAFDLERVGTGVAEAGARPPRRSYPGVQE